MDQIKINSNPQTSLSFLRLSSVLSDKKIFNIIKGFLGAQDVSHQFIDPIEKKRVTEGLSKIFNEEIERIKKITNLSEQTEQLQQLAKRELARANMDV